MYDTVIFDLDGTLLNTLEDLKNSVNYALAECGYPERSVDEIRHFVGNGVMKLMKRALPQNVSDEEFDKAFTMFKEYYDVHCNDLTGPYDGIMELVRELKGRGIRMGIASNKVKSAVDKLNDIYFDGLIDEAAGVVDGVITPKPAPDMVEDVLKRLNADRDHTLYVGDSQVDVATAKASGLDMVAVLWGFRDRKELTEAGATEFITEPMDLMRYL